MNSLPLALVAFSLALLLGQGSPAAAADGDLPRKGYLGVRLAPPSPDVRARQQLVGGAGVLIEAVVPNTRLPMGASDQVMFSSR